MSMDHLVPSLLDELEKIGVSYGHSPFPQLRKGKRPLRVDTLLSKDAPKPDYKDLISEDRIKPAEEGIEYEHGIGMEDGPSNV